MTTEQKIKVARKAVNGETFGTEAWESKMQAVRDLCAQEPPTQSEYTSDSGFHNYILVTGDTQRKIKVAERW